MPMQNLMRSAVSNPPNRPNGAPTLQVLAAKAPKSCRTCTPSSSGVVDSERDRVLNQHSPSATGQQQQPCLAAEGAVILMPGSIVWYTSNMLVPSGSGVGQGM